MPEDESGYEAYVKYLYDRDVVPAASQHEKHHFHREEEFDYPLGQLARASATLKLVTAAPDLYRTFRAEALSDLLRQVAWGVERNDRVLDRLGFTDILDSEYLILAKGMRLEHLPPRRSRTAAQPRVPRCGRQLAWPHLPGSGACRNLRLP
jgi:hypothetical protein